MGEDSGGHSVAGHSANDVSCVMEFEEEQEPEVLELAADVTILDTGRKKRKGRSKLVQ